MHLFSRLRYTMQRLSEGLAGILLVVRHLFHKTGFKLHVRGKHGGRTIDEEGMISIAFDLTSVIRKTSCESSGWHHVKPPNYASSLGAGGVHKTWLSRHLTDSKSGCPRYPPMGKEEEDSNMGPLRDPVKWYGIRYAGTQVKQRDFQSKGIRTSPARLSFVLKISLCNLRPSIISSVPFDRSCKGPIIPYSLFETHLQGIIVVVFIILGLEIQLPWFPAGAS